MPSQDLKVYKDQGTMKPTKIMSSKPTGMGEKYDIQDALVEQYRTARKRNVNAIRPSVPKGKGK